MPVIIYTNAGGENNGESVQLRHKAALKIDCKNSIKDLCLFAP